MPSMKKSKVKDALLDLPAGLTVAVLVLFLLFSPNGMVEASTVSIKLTSQGLGLGTSNINHGNIVDPDVPGFYTSGNTGEGSVLQIQTDGLAGPGTIINPLFVTVTAREHLDITSGLPASHDFQAGIITISNEDSATPDGSKEGLGVKAFTVGTDGLRVLDNATGRAKIEGSKHVSGGTDVSVYNAGSPNGPPHVDEDVTFDFNPLFSVNANDIEVFLSDFETTDIIDLSINLTNGTFTDLLFLGTGAGSGIFENLGDKLWKLKFDGLAGLSDNALVDSFTIRANDDDPNDPRGTAEHFFITGLTSEANPVPIPGAIYLLGSGLIGLAGLRKKKEKS